MLIQRRRVIISDRMLYPTLKTHMSPHLQRPDPSLLAARQPVVELRARIRRRQNLAL